MFDKLLFVFSTINSELPPHPRESAFVHHSIRRRDGLPLARKPLDNFFVKHNFPARLARPETRIKNHDDFHADDFTRRAENARKK